MRTFVLAALVAGAVALAPSVRADTPPLPGPQVQNEIRFRVPDVKEGRLANGIRVLFVERHDVPLVSVHAISTIGAADAPPGVAELASSSALSSAYFSHWMRTTHKFNLIGAQLSSYADYRMTGVSTHAMAPYLEDAIADLAEVARVQFPDGDIVRQKRDEATDRLAKAESSSAQYAARELLYPVDHPYHYAQAGTVGAIRSVQAEALRTFWARAFTAANMTITASGDVSFDRLMKALEASFGEMPRGTATKPSAPAAPPLEPRKGIVLIDEPGTTQARVAVVAHGVPRTSPDFDALVLTTRVLDGLLHDRIRETYGSSYGVDASLEHERGTPPLWVWGSIENGGVRQGIGEILRSMADIRDGKVAPGDFEHNRMITAQVTARAFETSTATAGLLAASTALGLGVSDLRALIDRIRALTPADVQRVAAAHLDPAKLRIVVVGDAKALKPELEKLGVGPVEVRGRSAPAPSTKPQKVAAQP